MRVSARPYLYGSEIRTPFTVSDDTLVYNAEAFKVQEGEMVEELVKKLPGVEIDDNGKYTMNGRPITQILVDGKEFFGQNMQATLENLPADMVDQIKAYDRQSDMARILAKLRIVKCLNISLGLLRNYL